MYCETMLSTNLFPPASACLFWHAIACAEPLLLKRNRHTGLVQSIHGLFDMFQQWRSEVFEGPILYSIDEVFSSPGSISNIFFHPPNALDNVIPCTNESSQVKILVTCFQHSLTVHSTLSYRKAMIRYNTRTMKNSGYSTPWHVNLQCGRICINEARAMILHGF